MKHPQIEPRAIDALSTSKANARTHSKKQIKQIALSIQQFGFTNPVLIGADDEILAGHGRVRAARELGMTEVPTMRLSHLSPEQRRAYVLADNKLALNAGWDQQTLAIELQGLIGLDFDIELTGFSLAEVDFILTDAGDSDPSAFDQAEDLVPDVLEAAVSAPGDVWLLGRHKLICGDAREPDHYSSLLGAEKVDLMFTDPPYNVPIAGHVSGLGKVKHREFAMATGEMSDVAFAEFLSKTLSAGAVCCRAGAIAFVCMDWRHMNELLQAGASAFTELKNLCIWNKTNGGMGSFYRSKHELVFVYKVGTDAHVNTFGLDHTGRYRTNVWDYAGVNTMGAERMSDLAMHPTVKPVALIVDALKDCSRRGGIVLDMFGGSGSTLIAAEKCGRVARLLECDPLYCDTIIARFQRYTGKQAVHAATGLTFEDTTAATAPTVGEVAA